MIIGTCNFVSFRAACAYYAQYGYTSQDVNAKIEQKEIAIGCPVDLKPNQSTFIDNKEQRFFILERD